MFSFLEKFRSARRAHSVSSSAARATATQARRRRHCGLEQLEDRSLMAIIAASSDNQFVLGNSDSYEPAVSADGRYVAFSSAANNLVSGDTNDVIDIFLRDTLNGTVTRISTDSSGN